MGNTSGLAITSMILGIISMFFVFIPIVGPLFSIVAIIFGIIGLNSIKKDATLTGKGMAITGIVLGIIALLLSIMILIGMVALFNIIRTSNFSQNVTG